MLDYNLNIRCVNLSCFFLLVFLSSLQIVLNLPMTDNTIFLPTNDTSVEVPHFRLIRSSGNEAIKAADHAWRSKHDQAFKGEHHDLSENIQRMRSIPVNLEQNPYDKYLISQKSLYTSTGLHHLRSKRTILFWKAKKLIKFLFYFG